MATTPYPSDVSDEERSFVAPYLTLMREDAPQRGHGLREMDTDPGCCVVHLGILACRF
jgi:hypothetical protein